jgi:hypothetical protein
VPPNVHFEVDDIEKRWMYNEPFDYIHSRAMTKSIADWPTLVRQCYKYVPPNSASLYPPSHPNRFTKPSGWVEFQDFDVKIYSDDGSLLPDHNITHWNDDIIEASRIAGRDPSPGPKLEGWVRDAGFENVVHQKFPVPIGPWPADPALVSPTLGAACIGHLQDGSLTETPLSPVETNWSMELPADL